MGIGGEGGAGGGGLHNPTAPANSRKRPAENPLPENSTANEATKKPDLRTKEQRLPVARGGVSCSERESQVNSTQLNSTQGVSCGERESRGAMRLA